MDIEQVLSRAQELLKSGWTKGALARDENNQFIGTYEAKACKFCLYGAVLRACLEETINYELFYGAIKAIQVELVKVGVVISFVAIGHWNDQQTSVEPIIELLERAKQNVSATHEG